jgi:ParB/RepB/Spo0J family partition protein
MHSTATHFDAPTSRLVPSPLNPRKTINDLSELTESIRSKGVLQSLLVRPGKKKNGKQELELEIVCGERRWRAAQAAGVTSVPVVLRELDDEAALEAMVVENSQRADVHPLEEADGIAALRERGRSVEEIAAKLGRPSSFVTRRLQLCTLSPMGRENFLLGRISAGVAEILARVPHEKLQDEALEELLRPRPEWDRRGESDDGTPTVAAARAFVRDRLMRRLSEAQWDVTDAALVPAAGACKGCPKRTGAQAELFPDLAKEDLCTDALCWQSKGDAEWKRRQEHAKSAGLTVLSAKESKKLYPYQRDDLNYNASLVELDDETWVGGKKKTWRSLIGTEKMPQVALARTPSGRIVELVSKKEAEKALPKSAQTSGYSAPKPSAAEQKRRAEEKAKATARDVVVQKLVEVLRGQKKYSSGALEAWLGFIVEGVASQCRSYDGRRDAKLLERRGVEVASEAVREVGDLLVQYARGASTADRIGLAVEMLLRRDIDRLGELEDGEPLFAQRMLEHAGVDWLAIEKAAIEEAREKLAAKTAKKKSSKKKGAKKARAK